MPWELSLIPSTRKKMFEKEKQTKTGLYKQFKVKKKMPMLAHSFQKGSYNPKVNLSFHKSLYATTESDNVSWKPPNDFMRKDLVDYV